MVADLDTPYSQWIRQHGGVEEDEEAEELEDLVDEAAEDELVEARANSVLWTVEDMKWTLCLKNIIRFSSPSSSTSRRRYSTPPSCLCTRTQTFNSVLHLEPNLCLLLTRGRIMKHLAFTGFLANFALIFWRFFTNFRYLSVNSGS